MQQATINYEAIRGRILEAAREGMQSAAAEMEQRAKKHAPVRDVFSSTRRRSPESVPRGIQHRDGKAFGRRVRHHQDAGRDRFLSQVKRQSRQNKQTYIDGARVRGSSRGLDPLVRAKDGSFRTGRLRSVSLIGGRIIPSEVTTQSSDGRTRLETARPYLKGEGLGPHVRRAQGVVSRHRDLIKRFPAAAKAAGESATDEGIVKALQRSSLTERRRLGLSGSLSEAQKDLRSSGLRANELGELSIGGRLRDEIYSEVKVEGDRIYADVISPTEYGKYQEYGTSHNRAQPYMRPALYEMRGRLRGHIDRALNAKIAKTGRSVRR